MQTTSQSGQATAAGLAGAEPHSVARVVIVIPVYRDWDSASLLCRELDRCWSSLPEVELHVLLIDDGSPEGWGAWDFFLPTTIRSLSVLPLKTNLGHQRAITAGLCYVYESLEFDFVLVMDADGEDRPEDSVVLARRALEVPDRVVFAQRRKRMESPVFRAGYLAYRLLHRALAGVSVRVGNFSVLPRRALDRLVCMPGMWNHYAGAIFRSKLHYEVVSLDRGRRYRGTSHMNLVALVSHGLAGIASFQDVVATRLLILSGVFAGLAAGALGTVLSVRLFTNLAVPGWATYTAGLLLIILLVIVATSFNLVFTLIATRSQSPVVPIRDYHAYVDDVEPLHAATPAPAFDSRRAPA